MERATTIYLCFPDNGLLLTDRFGLVFALVCTAGIFRFIAFFVIMLALPLSSLENGPINFDQLLAENIKIYFSEEIEIKNFEKLLENP